MTTRVKVRKADAEKVLAAVKARYKGWFDKPEDGPQLLKDYDYLGLGPAPYAVLWEGGPHEWAIAFTAGDTTEEERSMLVDAAGEFGIPYDPPAEELTPTIPDEVFCEPVTSFILGIYDGR